MNTADILREKKDLILENWLRKVKEEIPMDRKYDKTAIENSVPDLIDSLIEILYTGDAVGIKSHSIKHGWQRTNHTSYSMIHIIKEYNLLRSVIFSFIDNLSEEIPHSDRDIIINGVNYAIENAAEAFYKAQQEVQINGRKIAEIKADRLKIEDKNREEFIQAIMHDLSSPLNNIKTCTEMMDGELDLETAKNLVDILKASIVQAEFLIEDFLDIGSVDHFQNLPINKSMINVTEELKQQINIFKITYRREFILNASDDEILVNLDRNLIRRAFCNLLDNAMKHGLPSKPIIINCHSKSGRLNIAVSNHGKEIPKDIIESIFKRYYKTTHTAKGWGIGLAFVKKVAEAHDGNVYVESSENGTVFRIDIPANS